MKGLWEQSTESIFQNWRRAREGKVRSKWAHGHARGHAMFGAAYPATSLHCQGHTKKCGEVSNSDLWANGCADREVSWLEGNPGSNLHARRSELYLPARRNVMRQVSLGMYSLRREPLKTYSTTASERPALCRKGRNCLAFCVSWWTKRQGVRTFLWENV